MRLNGIILNDNLEVLLKYKTNKDDENKPVMFMLVGLPGSGKSYLAERIYVNRNNSDSYTKDIKFPTIYSSDKLREEMFGSMDVQDRNSELFAELHNRIKYKLKNNEDVIYDATNINKKKRTAFLNELKNIDCYKVCLNVIAPYEVCREEIKKRERVVPEDVLKRMYLNYNPPHWSEGFDDIILIYNVRDNTTYKKYNYDNFLYGDINAVEIDQENKHHTKTIGNHCISAYECSLLENPTDYKLSYAALYHDCGKPFTKSHLNSKGESTEDAHYYNHHCCGSYDSFLYALNDKDCIGDFTCEEIIYIANLIYYHMHPFLQWRQSEKARERDKKFLGEEMYNDIMELHRADLAAQGKSINKDKEKVLVTLDGEDFAIGELNVKKI